MPLAMLAYLGRYTRYIADDYCSASARMVDGFSGAQRMWYEHATGSVAFNFAITALSYAPTSAVRLWPAVALVAWLAALAWAGVALLAIRSAGRRGLVALWLAAVIVGG